VPGSCKSCSQSAKLILSPPHCPRQFRWCLYVVSLSFFHFSEFLTTALYKPDTTTYDCESPHTEPTSLRRPSRSSLKLKRVPAAFVINHSEEYTAAAIASWAEYWLELWFFPGMKGWVTPFLAGFVLLSLGQACRIIAMHTAKHNFNHLIMEKREANHQLVTHGIYR
jgi:protein-S-isoprenylcysteine O-methyltransferase